MSRVALALCLLLAAPAVAQTGQEATYRVELELAPEPMAVGEVRDFMLHVQRSCPPTAIAPEEQVHVAFIAEIPGLVVTGPESVILPEQVCAQQSSVVAQSRHQIGYVQDVNVSLTRLRVELHPDGAPFPYTSGSSVSASVMVALNDTSDSLAEPLAAASEDAPGLPLLALLGAVMAVALRRRR